MTLHYLDKQRAVTRSGAELQRRGWNIFDYDPGEADGMRDYYRLASWGGVAVHPDLRGIVVGVDLSAYDVKQRSGYSLVLNTSTDTIAQRRVRDRRPFTGVCCYHSS